MRTRFPEGIESTSPIKLVKTTLSDSPENGFIEVDNDNFYLTIGGIRQQVRLGRSSIGELYEDENAVHSAASVVVTNGTINSGSVTDTQQINQTYLIVQETGAWTVDFTFNDHDLHSPAIVRFVGRYTGGASHQVFVLAYNYNTLTWDRLTTNANDIPTSTTDGTFSWAFPADSTPYIDGSGNVKVRFQHSGNPNNGHHFYVDYVAIVCKHILINNANTFQIVTGLDAGTGLNTVVNAANGTLQTIDAGYYEKRYHASLLGVPGATYHTHIYVNGVECPKSGAKATITAVGQVVMLSGFCCDYLNANDVLDIRITADTSGVFAAFEYLNFEIGRK